MHTTDGGQTWEWESALVTSGASYLTRDGTMPTVVGLSNKVTVLRHLGD